MRLVRSAGFTVNLVYLYLDAPELSMKRVLERVAQGGHFVPDDNIRRRYPRSLFRLSQALLIADYTIICDNSGPEPLRLVEARADVILFRQEDLPSAIRLMSAD